MSPSQSKVCRNCNGEFEIEPDDLSFYQKLGVLAPDLCPLCRAERRLAFRNERVFYKRKCDKCDKDAVSMYSPNKPHRVWCYDCWFSEDWDGSVYARTYNPERSFVEQFEELWKEVPKIALMHVRSVNSEYLNISADNKDCYMIVESSNNEGCTHSYWIQECRDCVDVSFASKTQLSYECDDCYDSYKILYSKGCHDCRDGYFLLGCRNCSNCIGCTNLRSREYHIFNRPVSKEEYESLIPKIKKHMEDMPYKDSKGNLYSFGEFFPPEIAPFAYNETVAQEYFPISEQEAKEKGYTWKDQEDRHYSITMSPEDLPDNIRVVSDAITKEIIGCAHKGECNEQCTTAFRIIPEELTFYKKINIPLPRLCPNCRHYGRLKERTPMKLWKRQCQCAGNHSENGKYANSGKHSHGEGRCPHTFETAYDPKRPEIVYCEECYNAEVA